MNRITVIGNLVRDPELRYTNGSGKPVVHFTVASDRGKKSGSATDYLECEAWVSSRSA